MNNELFDKYKLVNLEIIDSIKNDNEDISLFEKREKLIGELFNLNWSKEQKRMMYNNMGLVDLDKEIERLLKEKMIRIKEKINKIAKNKAANKSYNSVNRRSNFFSANV
ncbi:flagellar protein FliT [Clostridium sp. SM-530-WT-3G]|uniref:flagellar protein FliT n=1 Tax=Clostridium sp. SM-530-WT-3G TaxID=2725303 RepID=UPI00145F99A7|nr:flagellar protein FliT [Clostridium sp. SM-530-WT-3G]NME82794.1 flagellar protein FliT [Clostridium sp. SM-530-WT-3G]